MSDSNYIINGPAVPDDDYTSLGRFFIENMEKFKEKIAKIIGDTDEKITYGELLINSIRLAQHLQKKNLTPNDVICACSYNTLESDLPFFAATYIGVPVSYLDPSLTIDESSHLLSQIKPKIIFSGLECLKLMEDALQKSELESEIIVFGNTDKYVPFSKFLVSTGKEDEFKPVEAKKRDIAAIYFSSGTTGLPKGVCNTHSGILRMKSIRYSNPENHVFLYITTLHWISAVNMLVASIVNGVPRLTCKYYSADALLKSIEKYKATFIFSTPYFFMQLTKYASNCNRNYDTTSIRFIGIGGETLKEKNILELKKYFPNAFIANGYGLTEAAGGVTGFSPIRDLKYLKEKPTSVGKAVAGMSYKIVDPETNEILGPNKQGEIRIKSDYLMNGYYNLPKETADVWDDDGYFKTGDIGYYDEDQCFYVVDRIKEMFKYKMWPVAPAELENILLKHPDVKEAVVIGIPHDEDQSWPMGVVVPRTGSNATEQDILDFINDQVIDRKKLRGGIKFVTSLPHTSTGKIKRRELKQMIIEEKGNNKSEIISNL